ncbi:unnamed protein product, partial [Dicrocoelium dendriticum]
EKVILSVRSTSDGTELSIKDTMGWLHDISGMRKINVDYNKTHMIRDDNLNSTIKVKDIQLFHFDHTRNLAIKRDKDCLTVDLVEKAGYPEICIFEAKLNENKRDMNLLEFPSRNPRPITRNENFIFSYNSVAGTETKDVTGKIFLKPMDINSASTEIIKYTLSMNIFLFHMHQDVVNILTCKKFGKYGEIG